MQISPERFITTLQYPLAPPLPFFTDGPYPYAWRGKRVWLRLTRRGLDASATALVRLVATPVLTTAGAARLGWHGAHWRSAALVPAVVAGAGLGCLLGLAGCVASLVDLSMSAGGATLVFWRLTSQAASEGRRSVDERRQAAFEHVMQPFLRLL